MKIKMIDILSEKRVFRTNSFCYFHRRENKWKLKIYAKASLFSTVGVCEGGVWSLNRNSHSLIHYFIVSSTEDIMLCHCFFKVIDQLKNNRWNCRSPSSRGALLFSLIITLKWASHNFRREAVYFSQFFNYGTWLD
jgi:hypothetical protein